MVYDVAKNKKMKTLIEHVVEKAIAISEQKTEAKLDNLELSMELTTVRPRYKDLWYKDIPGDLASLIWYKQGVC